MCHRIWFLLPMVCDASRWLPSLYRRHSGFCSGYYYGLYRYDLFCSNAINICNFTIQNVNHNSVMKGNIFQIGANFPAGMEDMEIGNHPGGALGFCPRTLAASSPRPCTQPHARPGFLMVGHVTMTCKICLSATGCVSTECPNCRRVRPVKIPPERRWTCSEWSFGMNPRRRWCIK